MAELSRLQVVDFAFRLMGDRETDPGPSNLVQCLRDALDRFGILGCSFGAGELVDSLLVDDVNAPERNLFGKYLRAWDSFVEAEWAAETDPYTATRRHRVYSLLGVDADFETRCDQLIPVWAGVEQPILIAEKHEIWYTPDRQIVTSFYWDAYRRHLEEIGSWPAESISELTKSSKTIVSHLSDPQRASIYQTKGLVVGYVQSGKTANFTAVLARAADAGYRLFVVLAGTLNILREQTQRRIDKELIGKELIQADADANGMHDYFGDRDWAEFVAHGEEPLNLGHFNWERLTGAREDYVGLGRGIRALAFPRVRPDRRFNDQVNLRPAPARIVIVKKNARILRKLCDDLSRVKSSLNEVPALVIDDESDQASLNTKPPKQKQQLERTATNKQIVRLLGLLKRAQYIGYTATPFASVLTDPTDAEDIFPKDYILALGRPPGYMGVRDFFDVTTEGVEIPEEERPAGFRSNERAFLRDITEGDDEHPNHMPRAIDSFVIAGALKLFREDRGVAIDVRHHTMLVHKSVRLDDHRDDAEMVRAVLSRAAYGTRRAYERLEKLWDDDFAPVSKAQAGELPRPAQFGHLKSYLDQCVARFFRDKRVLVVNGEHQDDTPNFDRDQVWNILVGGTKLSRGYTIEGLTISYYRRKARAADTLMQMGRWFGFRKNYADLVRLFVGRQEPDGPKRTFDLYEAFKAICFDEEAFRRDLGRYASLEEPRITPREVPPLVPSHMLPPTSANKRFNARVASMNFGGGSSQPTVLPTKQDLMKENAELMSGLLQNCDLAEPMLEATVAGDRVDFKAVVGEVSPAQMRDFLGRFRWAYGRPLDRVLEFLDGTGERDPDIRRWWILAPQQKKRPALRWGPGKRFGVRGRARVGGDSNRFKVFSEPDHVKLARSLQRLEPADDIAEDARGLIDEHAGVMLFYPVVEPGKDLVHSSKGAVDDREVSMGFALHFPKNQIPGPPVSFVVCDSRHPDSVTVDATGSE